MKKFKDSVLSFKCQECSVSIYNATINYKKCPECGAKLEVVKGVTNGS